MAKNQELKQRIRSIKNIMKITKAMEMIANAKLLKTRKAMEKNREYTDGLYGVVSDILKNSVDIENQYLKTSASKSDYILIFSNDFGMCGGYSSKLNTFINQEIKDSDKLILVGHRSKPVLKHQKEIKILNSDTFEYQDAKNIVREMIDAYLKDEVRSLKIIYTEFINSINFEPKKLALWPLELKDKTSTSELIFEPNSSEILDDLIPMLILNMIYSTYTRAKTSEQAARRLAMEKASDNAEELKEDLTLAYNRTRQQGITQEITEIVAGADAL